MANEGEYKSKIGLDNLYIAEVTADSAAAYTADTPAWLAPAAEASQEPSTAFQIQYADDQPYDVATSEGETKLALKITGLDLETLAMITGKVFDDTTGRMYDNGGIAPFMALGFRSKKSNGSYRYYWYLKGKFDMPKEAVATLADKPDPKTLDLSFTAIRTVYKFDLGDIDDSVKRVIGDDDTAAFDDTGWFTQVQVPGVLTPSALAMSPSVPGDGTSNISITANQTLTFNNALPADAANHIMLILASDASQVAGTVTLDATKKIVTIDPTASLTNSVAYIITYAVTDIYGSTLKGAVNFTTAAP
jgi:phi13 family phage major tail protein